MMADTCGLRNRGVACLNSMYAIVVTIQIKRAFANSVDPDVCGVSSWAALFAMLSAFWVLNPI